MAGRRKGGKDRDRQLTDFVGLREAVIAHNAMLRARQPRFETTDDDEQSLMIYFAG